MTTSTPLTEWAEYLAAIGASPATIRTRISTMKSLMTNAKIDDPSDLTRRHVVAFLARDRQPWTKLTYWRSISAWDTYAQDFDMTDTSIMRGIPAPPKPKPAARPIDTATIHRVLAAPLPARPRAYVLLALYAGLRVHEIAKLRGEDLDLIAGWLTVKGKGGVTDMIPLHPKLIELARKMPEYGPWFPSDAPSGHVHPKSVTATIGNALRSIGSTATAHQLRDTGATDMQRRGKDIRVTQAFLRHRDLSSTMKYTAVSNADLKAAVLQIEWENAA